MENSKIGQVPSVIKMVLLGTLTVSLISLIIAQTILTGWKIRETGSPYSQQITVDGVGSADSSPDTASLYVGIESKAKTVGVAQEDNTKRMNGLISTFRDLGIPEEDLKTASYNVYEDEEWNPETYTYETKGWIVSQDLTITIRDLSLVSKVISKAGEANVTNLSSLNFYTDDATSIKQIARDEAITNAKAQAQAIADALGVEIFAVVNYSEWSYGDEPMYYDRAMGMGGVAESAIEPTIQPGTQETTVNVSITYELR